EHVREEIKQVKNKNLLVIVEGKKDKKAMENLGITNIETLSKTPLYKVIEDTAKKTKEATILTDLDKKGKELYHKLMTGLQKHRVKINNKLRKLLFKARVSHIEGLNNIRLI
ncbi:hypothetical protein DRJ22_02415, partial [Candidatus Woesearchaeota archaeon]